MVVAIIAVDTADVLVATTAAANGAGEAATETTVTAVSEWV